MALSNANTKSCPGPFYQIIMLNCWKLNDDERLQHLSKLIRENSTNLIAILHHKLLTFNLITRLGPRITYT